MDINKEREAFDAYFKDKYPELHKDVFDENGDARAIVGYSFAWTAWKEAKAQAVPEKDAVIKKLSDQLYEQEMKTSAARVLCETACELLDDYAHQDAMVILNDLEQAMSTGASQ